MDASNILKGFLITLFTLILYQVWHINAILTEVNEKIPRMTVYTIGELDRINKLREEELHDGIPEGEGEGNMRYNLQSVFRIEGNVEVTNSLDVEVSNTVDVSGSEVEIYR